MFMKLGMKLDNLIVDIKLWNTQRVWYKIYAHFYIIRQIKTKAFKDEDSFNYFMNMTIINKQIWGWQYQLFHKMYKEV